MRWGRKLRNSQRLYKNIRIYTKKTVCYIYYSQRNIFVISCKITLLHLHLLRRHRKFHHFWLEITSFAVFFSKMPPKTCLGLMRPTLIFMGKNSSICSCLNHVITTWKRICQHLGDFLRWLSRGQGLDNISKNSIFWWKKPKGHLEVFRRLFGGDSYTRHKFNVRYQSPKYENGF